MAQRFEEILLHRNLNDQVYLCDVRRYFKVDLQQAREIQEVLTKISDSMIQNGNPTIR